MVRVRELGQHAGRVLVRGVVEIPPLQDGDGGHAEVLNPGVVGQPAVWLRLFFVVVDMRVARMPAAFGEIAPAFKRHVQCDVAGACINCLPPRRELRAALNENLRVAARDFEREPAVGVEERLTRPALPHCAFRGERFACRPDDLHSRLHQLAGAIISDLTSYSWHFFSLPCCSLAAKTN